MSQIDLALGPGPAELAAVLRVSLLVFMLAITVSVCLVTPAFLDWLASLCLGAWRTLRRLFHPRRLKGPSS